MKLHGSGLRALPVNVLADYCDVKLAEAPFTPGITDGTAAFKAISPAGEVRTAVHPCRPGRPLRQSERHWHPAGLFVDREPTPIPCLRQRKAISTFRQAPGVLAAFIRTHPVADASPEHAADSESACSTPCW